MMNGLWLASYILLWVLLIAVAVVLVSALRNLGVVYSMVSNTPAFSASSSPPNQRSRLTKGDKLPDAKWVTAGGELLAASNFIGSKTAFAVVSPSCGPCTDFFRSSLHDGPDPFDKSLSDFITISLGTAEKPAELPNQFDMQANACAVLDRNAECTTT